MAKLIPNELLFAGNGNVTEEIDKIHDITAVEINKYGKIIIIMLLILTLNVNITINNILR